ncbi:GNAT family N-acetyltransferase [Azospirillum doebereinerae]|uniref:GNAT family N-acetyltransferase n=1 Tax=Azospirillum doebereinerae TaxID=92933 RepID=UPI001EE60A33|nr:GNAT family N-acetyltransferase [Azospirillum doebereinerae]MCG5242221.1 GNAT family N-acetyltransferase [Azospirillum doebereinerae]
MTAPPDPPAAPDRPLPRPPAIVPLEGEDGRAFARWTFPAFRERLAPLDGTSLAFGAWAGDRPVGLALAHRAGGAVVLLSVSVDPAWRRCGIAARLLAALAAAVPDGQRLTVTYSSKLPAREAFEALLRRAGWGAPVLQSMRAAGTPGAVLAWAERHAPALRVLRSYDLRLWKDATPEDHAEVRRLIDSGAIDADFSPFAMAAQFEHWPDNSWLIRRDRVAAGWMFARLQPPDTVWYHGAAVRRDLEQTGPLLMMFHRVHQVAAERLGPDSVWRIDSFPRTPAMLAFMRRRVAAFAGFLDELYRVDGPSRPEKAPDPAAPPDARTV